VGPAKQNIEGSKRQNFCAGGAPPTSPDRLKLSLQPSQPENVKSIARKISGKNWKERSMPIHSMETHAITLARPEVFSYYALLSGGTLKF